MTATVTDAAILDLAHGQRQDGFSFVLLDSARNVISPGLLNVEGNVQITNDSSRTVFRTASGVTITNPPDVIDLTRHRAQALMNLSNGSVYSLGIFMFGTDARQPFTSGEAWTPALFDETFLLQQRLPKTEACAKGDSLLTFFTKLAATQVLDPLGIPYIYDVTDYPSGTALTYKVGTPRLEALNAVASALGCFPPYFDNDGVHRLKTAPETITVGQHVYGTGGRIFSGTTTITSDMYQAPNQWIVVGKDLQSGTVKGTFNLQSWAPGSAAQAGRTVTADVHTVPGLVDAGLAYWLARADSLTDLTAYNRADFSAAADPRHDTFDTVDLLGDLYLENAWTLDLTAGGDHRHSLTRAFG